MDAFAIARLLLGAAFLTVAAFLDVRTRRVRDLLWILLGTLGLVILAIELTTLGVAVNEWLLVVSAAILFYAVFYGKPLFDEDGFRLRPIRILVFAAAVGALFAALLLPPTASTAAASAAEPERIARLASMPIMVLLYQGFFQLGLLRGGADAKAMIALTILVPLYPEASPYPLLAPTPNVLQAMQVFFPYSLIVLMDAAVLFLAVPLAYLVLNAVRGDFEFPQAFLGTKASLDHLPQHVWLMERVDRRGDRVVVLFPSHAKDEREEVQRLRAAGATRVWVQPKVPFIVPLLAGFVLAFFVGNLVLGFLAAVLPHT